MNFWEFWGTAQAASAISAVALIVSGYALFQASRHRRQDLNNEAHATFVEVKLELSGLVSACKDLKGRWQAYFAAAGTYQSGARIKSDNDIDDLSNRGEALCTEMRNLDDETSGYTRRISVNSRRKLNTLEAKTKALAAEIKAQEDRLTYCLDQFRKSRRM